MGISANENAHYIIPVFASGEVVNINGSNYSTYWDADNEYMYFFTY